MNISIIDIEENLPKKVITNEYFGEAFKNNTNVFFKGCKERRHMEKQEMAVDYLAEASKTLLERNDMDISNIDMILTNVSLPDMAFTGAGAILNKRLSNVGVKWIIDLHNSGCISFLYMMDVAKSFMLSHGVKNALICTGQTAAGRIFGHEDNRNYPQSAIPGDGFAVALVRNDDSRPILHSVHEILPDNSEDMKANFKGKNYWEKRDVTGFLEFDEDKSAQIINRGNKLVPKMIYQACKEMNIKVTDIDFLITNQPNTLFLRNWREACLLPEERHLNTFSKYSNLFGAGIPITLAEAMKENKFKKGDLICLAGFAHAGDYAGATLIRW